jgi:CheY-like chemotaxis protein/anti-sigma regulatory factor (Ser/Thr protein kinase)
VLYGVVELTRPAWEAGAKRRGVVVNLHLDLKATHTIAGAASELREVFTNMVLNAVDAMPSGGELWITSADEPAHVRVRVRDTGVGMDHETRARVFDPFFTTKEVKGTGLGLSVAYGIVKRHRGQIEVISSPGAGTEFTLMCPVGEVPVELGPSADGPAPNALRALVADDEESVLSVLVEMLRGMGHQVTPALGGPEALELLRRETYDIVFTDLGMPEVNGWDVASLVKSRRPECAVVLVSGWGFQLEEDTAQAKGVDRVMAKPFSFLDVERSLRALFEPTGRRRAA